MNKLVIKQKCKENFKKIGDDVLTDLEPVIKKTGVNVLDLIKDVFIDCITNIFEIRKRGGKR